jgi:preprotein translocase subunit SecD
MDRSWWWRAAIIAAVTLGSIWFLVPSYYSFFVLPREKRNDIKALEQALPKWAPSAKDRLSLGLDLQGGIHMVMRVDTRTALEKRTERRGIQIASSVKDKNLGEVTVDTDAERLQLTLKPKDPKTLDAIEKDVLDVFRDFTKVSRTEDSLTLQLRDNQIDRFKQDAVEQAMLVIRRRIDKWGVAEVDVRTLGTDSIQISLPGRQDPEQAKELIGTTAQLEFRVVDDASPFFKDHYAKSSPPPEAGITLTSSRAPTARRCSSTCRARCRRTARCSWSARSAR